MGFESMSAFTTEESVAGTSAAEKSNAERSAADVDNFSEKDKLKLIEQWKALLDGAADATEYTGQWMERMLTIINSSENLKGLKNRLKRAIADSRSAGGENATFGTLLTMFLRNLF